MKRAQLRLVCIHTVLLKDSLKIGFDYPRSITLGSFTLSSLIGIYCTCTSCHISQIHIVPASDIVSEKRRTKLVEMVSGVFENERKKGERNSGRTVQSAPLMRPTMLHTRVCSVFNENLFLMGCSASFQSSCHFPLSTLRQIGRVHAIVCGKP